MALILFQQILIMGFLMGFGMLLVKSGILSAQGGKDLGAILLKYVIPCVVLKSFLIEFSFQRLRDLAISALLALIVLLVAMCISWFVFGKKKRIQNFAAAFGNAGFVGIPLVQAVFGGEAVFYVAPFVAFLNLFQWTYGLYIMTGNREVIKIKQVVKNPVFISIGLGFILFLIPFQPPALAVQALGYIAGLNTPVAMIILGSYLAEIDLKSIVFEKELYLSTALRLVILPFIAILILVIFPLGDTTIKLAILITASTSVGGNIAIFARQYNEDYILAVKSVCLSTLLCVITIPAIFAFAQSVIK